MSIVKKWAKTTILCTSSKNWEALSVKNHLKVSMKCLRALVSEMSAALQSYTCWPTTKVNHLRQPGFIRANLNTSYEHYAALHQDMNKVFLPNLLRWSDISTTSLDLKMGKQRPGFPQLYNPTQRKVHRKQKQRSQYIHPIYALKSKHINFPNFSIPNR